MAACRPFGYRMHGAVFFGSPPLRPVATMRCGVFAAARMGSHQVAGSGRNGHMTGMFAVSRTFSRSPSPPKCFLITCHRPPRGLSLHLRSLFTPPRLVATRVAIGTHTVIPLIASPRREFQAYCFMTNENQMSFAACSSP